MQLKVQSFRLELVRRLALETEFGMRTYQTGVNEKLAAELGVSMDTLRAAAEYVRRAFRPDATATDNDGLIEQRFWMAKSDHRKIAAMARSRGLHARELTRSILHHAMLSTLEPVCVTVTDVRFDNRRTKSTHTFASMMVSKGLLSALRQRGHAVGMEIATYVRSWLVNYAAGALPELKVKPVPLLGMYDDASNYIVPACWQEEAKTGS
jgi:hypothetical protein